MQGAKWYLKNASATLRLLQLTWAPVMTPTTANIVELQLLCTFDSFQMAFLTASPKACPMLTQKPSPCAANAGVSSAALLAAG